MSSEAATPTALARLDAPRWASWWRLAGLTVVALAAALALLCALALGLSAAFALGEGELVFESNRDGNWEIYRLDLLTGRQFNVTRNDADELGPAWSPDRRQIVFSLARDRDMGMSLFLVDADGLHRRPVAGDGGNNRRPAWSSDGRLIAFMHNYRRIRVLDLNTGAEEEAAAGFGPSWSPDARWLAYYDDPDGRLNGDIFVYDRVSRRAYDLTGHPANDWSPAWSPDGRWIAFASARSGGADLYVLDTGCLAPTVRPAVCAASVRRLTSGSGSDYDPAWSPDSRRLAYVSEREGSVQIRVINADGSGDRQLIAGPGINRFPGWRPGR